MRQRVEDLGRLLVMIENTLDLSLFDHLLGTRPKDSWEYWNQLDDRQKEDRIIEIAAQISMCRDLLFDMREVAMGEDFLNQPPDGMKYET